MPHNTALLLNHMLSFRKSQFLSLSCCEETKEPSLQLILDIVMLPKLDKALKQWAWWVRRMPFICSIISIHI